MLIFRSGHPVRRPFPVQNLFRTVPFPGRGGLNLCPGGDVAGIQLIQQHTEARQRLFILFMNAAAAVRRHIQIQIGPSAYAVKIQLQQIFRRPDAGIFMLMPEPARANGNIHLRGNPVLAVHGAFRAQPVAHGAGRGFRPGLQRNRGVCGPAGITRIAAFIAYPADIRPYVGKDDGSGLPFLQLSPSCLPVVIRAMVDRTFFPRSSVIPVPSVRSVKPSQENGTVSRRQLFQLLTVHPDIIRRSVRGGIAVPRRQINTEPDAILSARAGHLLHHIALPLLPRRSRYTMEGRLCGPQTKTVMMLAGQHHPFEPGVRQRPDKIIRIEIGRMKQLRLFVSIAPLFSSKGINRKMDKGIHLHVMPFKLLRGRNRL